MRARTLFLEAAGQGDTPSMYTAGHMLFRGEGGEVNRAAGVALLTSAADSGHIWAQRALLRLQLADARTMRGRLHVHWKVLRLAWSMFAKAARDPDFRYSDDIKR